LFQGQPDEAIPLLAHTVEASPPELIAETVIGCLGHALASCQIDDLEGARASLTRAERIIASSDGCRYNVLLEFTRYRVSGAIQHLLAAHDELQRQASLFADARLRNDFIEQVHWNREVRIHWLRLRSTSEPLHVRLARLDAPLGKHLTDDERVDVSWNVDDGDGDAETLRQAGKAAQRRRRLRRLLLEARAQGAVPTDADLARALDVTERTIRRDMQALKAENQPVSTRRRKKLIS
jgi:biotin operon repressor